jgi:hypothetical protein
MKTMHGKKIAFLILFTSVFLGCRSEQVSPAINELPKTIAPLQPTTIETPDFTPSPTPTSPMKTEAISINTKTVEPLSVTPSPIPASATPALMPTDPAREKKVRDLLQTNAGCKLPCWWGISPDETTWKEAEVFLQSLGMRTSVFATSNDLVRYSVAGVDLDEYFLQNSLMIGVRHAVVDSIGFEGHGEHNPKEFPKIWNRFSPENVVAEYGPPSRIMIFSDANAPVGSNNRAGYGLWFWYDNIGFVIQYTGLIDLSHPYLLCPNSDWISKVTSIRMWLQSSENNRKLESLTYFQDYHEYFYPLEEATNLSVDEFSSELISGNDPVCFETSKDIWP